MVPLASMSKVLGIMTLHMALRKRHGQWFSVDYAFGKDPSQQLVLPGAGSQKRYLINTLQNIMQTIITNYQINIIVSLIKTNVILFVNK